VLGLRFATPPDWARTALEDPTALLRDHYFCETKAAARARALVRAHGIERPSLVSALGPLVAEEEEHARLCRRFLKERVAEPGPVLPDPYVAELRRRALGGGRGDLLDQLLAAGLIEARSCERFGLLADGCGDLPLGRFYEDLFAAEARHHSLFLALAGDLFEEPLVRSRLEAMSRIEGAIAASLPWRCAIH
jgi:tRNA-(ms[2]io[6]A)-hydroxylase